MQDEKQLTCLRVQTVQEKLKLKTFFRLEDGSCSLKVGKWFDSEPTECYKEIQHLLHVNPEIPLVDGKMGRQSRDIAFFSNASAGYTYTNQTQKNFPLTSRMQTLLETVNRLLNTQFNGILVNRYKNGRENYIGEHQDAEAELETAGVFSITIFPEVRKTIKSPTRIFRIRSDPTADNTVIFTIPGSVTMVKKHFKRKPEGEKGRRDHVLDVYTGHLDCCWMEGATFQQRFFHSVPLQASAEDCRVSFTFRCHRM